jgi:hypothetical protein
MLEHKTSFFKIQNQRSRDKNSFRDQYDKETSNFKNEKKVRMQKQLAI